MSNHPWIKFYPRDWRGDQALRVVSLAARGLWMEMLCIMHEASPYGHLLIGAKPVTDDALARAAGARIEEVQALLVELHDAGVFDRSRNGVILSRRMIADKKRSELGRKAKLEALENKPEKPRPSRVPRRKASTQKPDTRGKVEGPNSPSTLTDRERSEARHEGASGSASEGPKKSLAELRAILGTEEPATAEIIPINPERKVG